MKIESLKLKNFRSFFGETTIDFSTSDEKNVTIILADNGTGKTSILNAFKWCFYGETDFDGGERGLLNRFAVVKTDIGGFAKIEVEVKFNEDDRVYIATRTQKFYKISDQLESLDVNEAEFKIVEISPNGQSKKLEKPTTEIKRLLPQDLHPYFFFHGENIESLVSEKNRFQFREAIKKLLGMLILERASEHILAVKKQFTKEYKKTEGLTGEEQKLVAEISDKMELIDGNDARRKQLQEQYETLALNKKASVSELKKYKETIKLSEQREEQEILVNKLEKDLEDKIAAHHKLFERYAFLNLSPLISKSALKLIEENRKKGVLPYGIKEQFIKDRIQMGTCICGTTIVENSKEHKCLLDAMHEAGTSQQESTYIAVSGFLGSAPERVEDYYENNKIVTDEIIEIESKISQAKVIIEEIGSQIIAIDNKLIKDLEENRDIADKKMKECEINIGVIEVNNAELIRVRGELEKQLEKFNQASFDGKLYQSRIDKCAQLGQVFEELRDSMTNVVREDLSDIVNQTYTSMSSRASTVRIDEDYSLVVEEESTDGGVSYIQDTLNTGEKQIVSLSFISSLIAKSKEQHLKDKKGSLFQGGLYPLVMDSPFGNLGKEYRRQVAMNIPKLADQVILLVSDSQWDDSVEKTTISKVGKMYESVFYTNKPIKESQKKFFKPSLDGGQYSTVKEVAL